jgi:hypothetical protein
MRCLRVVAMGSAATLQAGAAADVGSLEAVHGEACAKDCTANPDDGYYYCSWDTGKKHCAVRIFRQNLALEDAIEFHAFPPHEANRHVIVTLMPFLSDVHFSRRFTLQMASKH